MTTPRRITDAQAATRAANGREHSTGPRTPEGKRASSANSLKHGGYAKGTPVIPSGPLAEDAGVYESFCTGVVASLKPEGALEQELATNVAKLMWRNRRPGAYEANYLAAETATSASYRLVQATQVQPWNEGAARVFANPDAVQTSQDLEMAAVAAGHAVGLFMDDDWPQPTPADQEAWDVVIDTTLASAQLTRGDALRYCEDELAKWDDITTAAAAEHHAAHVARALDEDLLLKTARAEAHIGRELTRALNLLQALQADRLGDRGEL